MRDIGLKFVGNNEQGFEEWLNEKDGSILIKIPAGEFLMGSPENEGADNEHPQHKVYLDEYYISMFEVTNDMFNKFVEEAEYKAEGNWKNYFNEETKKHPVISISKKDAIAYCEWAGLRLPTEAEWEKAARGNDGRRYPWGDLWDTNRCNNMDMRGIDLIYQMADIKEKRGTLPVDSFKNGTSPYGVMDMAGNAWEFCSDGYDENYYKNSSHQNPTGPDLKDPVVIRGGSWFCGGSKGLRLAARNKFSIQDFGFDAGFRCAKSPEQD